MSSGLQVLTALVRAGMTQGSLKQYPCCISEVQYSPSPSLSPPREATGHAVLAQRPSSSEHKIWPWMPLDILSSFLGTRTNLGRKGIILSASVGVWY